MKRNRILIIGPARGHNIQPFLDFFQSQMEYEATLLHGGKNEFDTKKYSNIKFVEDKKRIRKIRLYYSILRKKETPNLIWYHGGYNSYLLFLIWLIKSSQTPINLNIWGEKVPNQVVKKGFRGWVYKFVFGRVEHIHCNWISTYNIMKSIKTKDLFIQPWGIEKRYINYEVSKCISEKASVFIKTIPSDKICFFVPKSIIKPVRHDLIIKAVKRLGIEGHNNFVVYFWLGETNDPSLLSEYKKFIDKNNLQTIKTVKHNYIPYNDLIMIWNKMDAGIMLVNNDQLSVTFLETMLFKKELIASNILPYKYYNEKFNTELNLVNLDTDSVYNAMKKYIDGYKSNSEILDRRSNIVKEHFCFEKNIKKVLKRLL